MIPGHCLNCEKQKETRHKATYNNRSGYICEECYKKRVRFRPRGNRTFRGSSENKKDSNFPRKSTKKKPHFKRRKKRR